MDAMAPVKTFQLEPPAKFGADQLPRDQAVEFRFDGTAGQMLRVQANEPYRVRVQPSGDGSPLRQGWDSKGNAFYALPRTAEYQVLYAPWQSSPWIQFDFLPDNDPRADTGISKENISVDFGAFAREEDLAIAPLDLNEDSEDYLDSWPTHLAVAHDGFEFRVMTVAGYKKFFQKQERMTALARAIQAHGKNAVPKKLPYSIFGGGGLNFATRPQFVEGEGWRGLRWVGTYGQDIGCWFDDSAYVVEGVSNDGRFFVLIRAKLSYPKLAAKLAQDCETAPGDYSGRDEATFERAASALLDKAVSSADPASFRPSLDQLDAVLRSLKLKQ
jgi:hypothetical protein